MYDFFNRAVATAKGKSVDSSFIYIENTVIKNHNLVRRYINTSSLAVPPDHLIPKLILSLGLNISMSDLDTIYSVKDRTLALASSLNLASYTSFAKPYYNTLLDGGAEYILATNEDFDATMPWENLTPIEFLYHTYTNLDYKLGAHRDDSAIGIIKINLPMLAYQYHKWRCWLRDYDVEGTENLYQFAVKYPIFNSLKSYMDISWFNRLYYRLSERQILPDGTFGPQVPTANILPQIDRTSNNLLAMLANKKLTIGQALYHVPMFFEDTALNLVYDKLDLFSTRQTDWFEMVYKLPFIHFGLLTANLSGGSLDRQLISKLLYELKAFESTRGLEMLPRQQSLHIIENIFDPITNLAEKMR